MTETPVTLTIVHDANAKLLLCVGLRHRFDIINVQTKQVTLLKNIVTYRVSCMTYNRSSVFIGFPGISPCLIALSFFFSRFLVKK